MTLKRSLDQLRPYLEAISYPISKRSLIEIARERGADESVLSMLERLPDQSYGSSVGLHADLNLLSRSSG